jgi:hypothetical protein
VSVEVVSRIGSSSNGWPSRVPDAVKSSVYVIGAAVAPR